MECDCIKCPKRNEEGGCLVLSEEGQAFRQRLMRHGPRCPFAPFAIEGKKGKVRVGQQKQKKGGKK